LARKRIRPSLKVDKEEIANRVLAFYDTDTQARQRDIANRLQRQAKFRGWTEGKSWPWDDASDAAIPDLMEQSLRVQDTLHNAVMGSRPAITPKARFPDDKGKEQTISELQDFQFFVEQDGETIIGALADAFVNDGVFTAFIPWVTEKREVADVKVFPGLPDEAEPGEYFESILVQEFPEADRIPTRNEWDWTLEFATGEVKSVSFYTRAIRKIEMVVRSEALVHDGPAVIVKDYEDVIYPPGAWNLQIPGPSNPGGAAHVIIQDYPTIDEIRRLVKSGSYDLTEKDFLDRLEATAMSNDERQEKEQRATFEGTDDEQVVKISQARSQGKLTRLMCFDTYDLDGDGIDEDVVWWVIKETRTLLKARRMTEVYPSSPPRRPFAEASFLPVRGRRSGISLLEMLEGLHDLMKQLTDQTIDAGTIANVPFGFYEPSGSMKPEVMRLAPGELYPLRNAKNAVNFPTVGNSSQSFGLNMIAIIQQLEERLTMVGDLQLGRVPKGKSSALRTTGNMAILGGQGEARPERILRRFFQGLAQIHKQMHILNKANLPREKLIRAVGLKSPSDDPYKQIGDIGGVFDFDFQANAFNTSKSVLQESLGSLLSLYASPLALQLGIIDESGIYRLLRDVGKAAGQDPDEYIKEPVPGAMKAPIFAEEALISIMRGEIPEGRPAEGAAVHLQKIMEFAQADEFGFLTPEQIEVYKAYVVQVGELAQREARMAQLAESAGQLGGPGPQEQGQGPDLGQPPLNENELLDEALPTAGGGANG